MWPLIVQSVVFWLGMFLLVRAIGYRKVPKARYYLLLALAVVMYAMGYLLELDAHGLEAAYMAQRISYCGVAVYAVFFYLFIRDYNDRPVKSPLAIAALLAYPLVVIVLVNGYPDITLFFKELTFVTEPAPRLIIERGVFFHLHVLYSYALILLSAAEVLLHYPTATKALRRRRMFFLVATLVPNVAMIIFSLQGVAMPMELGSASLVVSLLILGGYILRFRAEDWLPYAREQIVQQLCDGYVLLDNERRYLDANPAALRLFPALDGLPCGAPVENILPLDKALDNPDPKGCEVRMVVEGEDTVLRLSPSPISTGGRNICWGMLIYDMSDMYHLMRELEESASHDGLTGLLNRDALFRTSVRDFELHLRTRQDACVLMMDIDLFKQVNDTYGHLCGDHVLRVVARTISARLRRTDICGRFGGEEFLVFLPATTLQGAWRIANHVRASVESRVFSCDGMVFRITLSVGMAQLDPLRHRTLDDMIAEADAALYKAKQAGRNRVVPDLHPPGGGKTRYFDPSLTAAKHKEVDSNVDDDKRYTLLPPGGHRQGDEAAH